MKKFIIPAAIWLLAVASAGYINRFIIKHKKMFTLEQIKQAHGKVQTGADFPAYIAAIKALGVQRYVTYVADGRTDYSGSGHTLSSPARYDALTIADTADIPQFKAGLQKHQQGGSDFPTFVRQCAELGIEKWIVEIGQMTCTYYDKAGNAVLTEEIPQ